jgi:hypothetical protein
MAAESPSTIIEDGFDLAIHVFIEHLEKTFALCSQFNPPSV